MPSNTVSPRGALPAFPPHARTREETETLPGVGVAAISGAVLLVLVAGIMLIGPYPLTNDGGSHVYNAIVARDLLQHPAGIFSGFAELRPLTVPNWGVPVLLWPLLAFGAGAAAKSMVVLSLVLGVASVAWFARSAGVDRETSVALGLVLGNTWFLWAGFWGFSLSTALAFFCIGWILRHRHNPRPRDAMLVALLQIAGVVLHPVPSLFVGLTFCALFLASRRAGAALEKPPITLSGAAASGPMLVAAFAASRVTETGEAPGFLTSGKELLESVVTFPMDAFETFHWPHADGRFVAGIGALVLAVAMHRRWRQRSWALVREPLLATAGVLLLVRFLAADAQLRGAFIDARLGYFAWVLLMVWAFIEAPARVSRTAILLMVVSSGLGVAMHLRGSAAIVPLVSDVVRAARDAGLGEGTTLVRVRFEPGTSERESAVTRVRLPYLLTHAVDWAAAETRARHLTNYELLGTSFAVRASGLLDTTRVLLRSLEEPDSSGHAEVLPVVMRELSPEVLAFVGTPPDAIVVMVENAGYERQGPVGPLPPVSYYRRRPMTASLTP